MLFGHLQQETRIYYDYYYSYYYVYSARLLVILNTDVQCTSGQNVKNLFPTATNKLTKNLLRQQLLKKKNFQLHQH